MHVTSPQSSEDFARYFQLRWEILRAPWGQAKGSEQDQYEAQACHIMVLVDNQVAGVGRLHATDEIGQIRYMAVRQDKQGLGVGSRILCALEEQAIKTNCAEIMLNARDTAVGFYKKHGYQSLAKGRTLYNEITHTVMQKKL